MSRLAVRLAAAALAAAVATAAGCGSSGSKTAVPASTAGATTARTTTDVPATTTAVPSPTTAAVSGSGCADGFPAGGWPRFGFDAARSNRAPSGPAAAALAGLRRQQVALPGTADSSPILLPGVAIGGTARNELVVTTTYGKAVGIDARDGRVLWTYTPPGIGDWQGSAQITTASPIADPDGRRLYTASPDGRIHLLDAATGAELHVGGWPVQVTRDATHEKLPSALNLAGCLLYVTTGGYIGDAPPYQGHVVAIDRARGRILHVYNALCSDRTGLLQPSTCDASGAAIWGRAAPAIDPATGQLLAATGNGDFDGRTRYGDSVLALAPDASALVQSYTPTNESELNSGDVDLGSTAPAILPPLGGRRLAVQGGKDAVLRLLDLARLNGSGGAGSRKGGELATAALPAGLFSAPAVATAGGAAIVVCGTAEGTVAYDVSGGSTPAIRERWRGGHAGTSPVIAGDLVYVFDPGGGGIHVYDLASGQEVATLAAGRGHWSSPIVVAGLVAVPEGDANEHATHGVLDIYR